MDNSTQSCRDAEKIGPDKTDFWEKPWLIRPQVVRKTSACLKKTVLSSSSCWIPIIIFPNARERKSSSSRSIRRFRWFERLYSNRRKSRTLILITQDVIRTPYKRQSPIRYGWGHSDIWSISWHLSCLSQTRLDIGCFLYCLSVSFSSSLPNAKIPHHS